MSKYLAYSDELTRREQEIYNIVTETGKDTVEIAEIFNLSKRTIRYYLLSIFRKCGVNSQKQLIIKHYKELLKQ